MKRKIYNDLIKWKEQTSHKPLMILGVRHILLMNFVKMNIKMLFKLIYYKEMI